jgi:hypothetical protein
MVLQWGEGGLRNLTMVGFGDSMVARNGYNSCYKEWHFGGIDHLGGQTEKSEVFFLAIYKSGDR